MGGKRPERDLWESRSGVAVKVFLGRLAEVEALRLDGTGNRKTAEPKAVFPCLLKREGLID